MAASKTALSEKVTAETIPAENGVAGGDVSNADAPVASIENRVPAPATALPDFLQNLTRRGRRWNWIVHFGWRFGERWGYDQCPLIAGAMAFFGLLSVFPAVVAGIAITVKALAGNQHVIESLQTYITQLFPGQAGSQIAAEITAKVESFAQSPNSRALSIVAIASLLWSGRAFFDTLAWQLNGIWPRAKTRTWWQHQLALWGTFLGAGLLWLLSTFVHVALSVLRALNDHFLNQYLPGLAIARESIVWDILTRFVAWLLTFFMFWLIYHFLPNVQTKQHRRVAVGAAMIAAVAWEIAKIAFTNFLGNLSRYEVAYGSVAGVVLTMMWIYFSSLIILLGAEAAATYEDVCNLNSNTSVCLE